LIDTQQACLQLFLDFADPAVLALEHSAQQSEVLAEIERLRRLALHPAGIELDPACSSAWYDACTLRMDGMKIVEDALAASLRHICERQVERAREGLRDQQAMLDDVLRSEISTP